MPTNQPPPEVVRRRWYSGLTRYHWWVLIIGAMSWTFDTMDQRIFVLSRQPALKQLMSGEWEDVERAKRAEIAPAVRAELQARVDAGTLPADTLEAAIDQETQARLTRAENEFVDPKANIITAAMIVGWSVGGFFFGVVGDRWGRVRTLSTSIFVYSIFTGLSGFSIHWYDFCAYRFLMGCGIGGAFATAATLIAETMPNHARAFALGMFQALSAIGNIVGSALATWVIRPGETVALFGSAVAGWRLLFFVGVLPAFLIVLIMRTVKEPEQWRAAQRAARGNLGRQLGDIKGLFTHPRWRRNTLVGMGLATAGVLGLWGIGFWSPELVSEALKGEPAERVSYVRGLGTLVQDVGAFFGMFFFTVLATRFGRKPTFAFCYALCYVVVVSVFLKLNSATDAYWMLPLMGFATLSVFGGFAIYFPEIYPTRLRATGTGFCYNAARVLAAGMMLFKIPMMEGFEHAGYASSFRAVAVVMSTVFFLGIIVLIWAPETMGRPLPTDDD